MVITALIQPAEMGCAKLPSKPNSIEGQLNRIKEESYSNPGKFDNEQKITRLLAIKDPTFEQKLKLANQFIFNGNTDRGIELLLILKRSKDFNSLRLKEKYRLKKMLAIAFLRYGEQVNCITSHSSESCVMPIQGKGLYAYKNFTED